MFAVLELLLQAGAWDGMLKRRSYAGKAAALRARIDRLASSGALSGIVSLGTSKTEVGLSETIVREELGLGLSNLALEGAGLPTIEAVGSYVLATGRRPKLFVLGVDPPMITGTYDRDHEVGMIAPYVRFWRRLSNLLPMFEAIPVHARALGLFSRLVAYRDDLRDFLVHPRSRLRAVRARRAAADPPDGLNGDLCAIPLDSPAECRDAAVRLEAETGALQWKAVQVYCRYLDDWFGEKRYAAATAAVFGRELSGLVADLGTERAPLVVRMPEIELTRRVYPRETVEAAGRLLEDLRDGGGIRLLDYSELFRGDGECRYFADPFHLNREGAAILSRRLAADIRALYPELFRAAQLD